MDVVFLHRKGEQNDMIRVRTIRQSIIPGLTNYSPFTVPGKGVMAVQREEGREPFRVTERRYDGEP